MSEKYPTRRLATGAVILSLVFSAVVPMTAVAGIRLVPPDRWDKVGVVADSASRLVPPDRADRVGVATSLGRQVPPDRADGLGSARLPTVLGPAVVVHTVPRAGFDWLAGAIGAMVAIACVLVVAAARLLRTAGAGAGQI